MEKKYFISFLGACVFDPAFLFSSCVIVVIIMLVYRYIQDLAIYHNLRTS